MDLFSADGRTGRVTVRGEVDMATAPALRAALDQAVTGCDGELVVDLTMVSFIDSSGINELLRPVRDGREVVVTGASPTVRRTFELIGLDAVVSIGPRA